MNNINIFHTNQVVKSAKRQLENHKKLGLNSNLTIFEVAQLMDAISFNLNSPNESFFVNGDFTDFSLS